MATESSVGVVDQAAAGVANAVPVDVTTVIKPATATSQNRQVVALGDPAAPLGLAPVDGSEGLSVSLADPRVLALFAAMLAQLQAIAIQLGAVVVPSPIRPDHHALQ